MRKLSSAIAHWSSFCPGQRIFLLFTRGFVTVDTEFKASTPVGVAQRGTADAEVNLPPPHTHTHCWWELRANKGSLVKPGVGIYSLIYNMLSLQQPGPLACSSLTSPFILLLFLSFFPRNRCQRRKAEEEAMLCLGPRIMGWMPHCVRCCDKHSRLLFSFFLLSPYFAQLDQKRGAQ